LGNGLSIKETQLKAIIASRINSYASEGDTHIIYHIIPPCLFQGGHFRR
jgi:hypothetical protein